MWYIVSPICRGGGHSTSGYVRSGAAKKTLLFFAHSHRKNPFLPTFTQWPPIFNKLLVTEIPWCITQRPLIFVFSSLTSDNFWLKIWIFLKILTKKLMKCEILALKTPIFWCISLKDSLFLCALSLKDPLFDAICHWKTPTLEVLGGTCTSLSYVSAPLPICRWYTFPLSKT